MMADLIGRSLGQWRICSLIQKERLLKNDISPNLFGLSQGPPLSRTQKSKNCQWANRSDSMALITCCGTGGWNGEKRNQDTKEEVGEGMTERNPFRCMHPD